MKKIKKLSIVIPVFNEEKTIKVILDKVYKVDFKDIKLEVIVVNDGSTDKTLKVVKDLNKKYQFKIINLSKNSGKSFALRKGFEKISGDVVTIQDGDLEYDPNDFVKMLSRMKSNGVEVVYGSRRLEKKNKQYSGLGFYIGGLFLTEMVNILYGGKITDEPTCYKMFDSRILKSIKLNCKKFEFCPEITAKILKRNIKIFEVPVIYKPRHVDQGKKIKLKDFFQAVWVLIKYRFVN